MSARSQSIADIRLADVLRATGVPDLVEILAERLSGPELGAMLREAYRRRAARMTSLEVLSHYEGDVFLRPAATDPAETATVERLALAVLAPQYEPIELSPVCPTGAVSVLAPVDPGAAWGAGGSSEVVSDCRSVLALEAAVRRRVLLRDKTTANQSVRLCTSHRELHAPFSAPLRSQYHSRVIGLCHAGTDEGDFSFEMLALQEQLAIHLRLLDLLRQEGFGIGLVTVAFFNEPGAELATAVHGEILASLEAAFPEVRIVVEHERRTGRGYYAPIGFTITAEDEVEVAHTVGMGGFTDWTRQLLGRVEERVLVSVIAVERLGEAFAPEHCRIHKNR